MKTKYFAALLAIVLVAGCKEETAQAELPDPLVLSEEAAGHYCQMIIMEHQGPKAQVHLAGYMAPLWFSQVRDGVAYLKSPEQTAEIQVLYVNDMGLATSWTQPGADNWINASEAYFVVGSDAVGGMGAPELVPFSDEMMAGEFVLVHGGSTMRLADISAETVLSPIEFDTSSLEFGE